MLDVFAIRATLRSAFEAIDLTTDPDCDLLAMLAQCPDIPERPNPWAVER
jgi:hypothetical protein